LERTLSMFNSLLKRCNQLSEQNAQLKKIATEDRKYCERQFASIDRVLEKHSFRIHTTYYAAFPKLADFNIELERVFDDDKKAPRKF
jgi:iron-sulfur cluster repair protein YtfE (RIC family)